ncbi:MAG: WbqC family protein [bacterium]
MKLAIMQPYFCPYIGYFQLINSVDKFVIYDDVQYIDDGLINRNRILIQKKKPYMFTLSVKNDSHTLDINQRYYIDNIDREKNKIMKTIKQSYIKASYYEKAIGLIDKLFNIDELNVSKMNTKSLEMICDYLDIDTEIIVNSNLNCKDYNLDGQERVIKINKCLGSDQYINSIGGQKLYSKSSFEDESIKLNFIETKDVVYEQFNNGFVPNLSIIDVLMFNSKNKINDLLNQYELI